MGGRQRSDPRVADALRWRRISHCFWKDKMLMLQLAARLGWALLANHSIRKTDMVILAALLVDDLWFCCWANKRLRRCFYRKLRGLKTTVVPGKLGRRRVCLRAVYILHCTVTSIPPPPAPQLRTSFNEQTGSSLTVQALCLFAERVCVHATAHVFLQCQTSYC